MCNLKIVTEGHQRERKTMTPFQLPQQCTAVRMRHNFLQLCNNKLEAFLVPLPESNICTNLHFCPFCRTDQLSTVTRLCKIKHFASFILLVSNEYFQNLSRSGRCRLWIPGRSLQSIQTSTAKVWMQVI